MARNELPTVDLGFVTAPVRRGSHICQIYVDSAERDHALRKFAAQGLHGNESTGCFTDGLDVSDFEASFTGEGLSLQAERSSGRFVYSGAEAAYFEGGYFDPERMLEMLKQFYQHSVERRCAGARVIGEMSPTINSIEGGSRIFEYEAGVNRLLLDYPMTAVCQYDARAFDGAMIMDVLTVHPMIVMRGTVVQNPLYVPPEEFLRQ